MYIRLVSKVEGGRDAREVVSNARLVFEAGMVEHQTRSPHRWIRIGLNYAVASIAEDGLLAREVGISVCLHTWEG